jgi:chaperone BCS1
MDGGDPNVVMFGIMSSMRTGNMILDMAVCLLIPFLFRSLWGHVQSTYLRTTIYLDRKMNRKYRRVISNTRSNRPWNETKTSHKNKVLITAVRMYIGREVKPSYPIGDIKLQAITATKSDSETGSGTLVEQLTKKYKILCIPQRNGVPIEIQPGLFFQDVDSTNREEGEDGKKTSNVTMVTSLTFTTALAGGKERVDAFLKLAYDWYCAEVAATEDHSYFMYQPLVSKFNSTATEGAEKKVTQFKRYRLSNEKTFKSIFFPEKEKVLRILRHFDEKSGKYSIAGFPHKLGLLLHGPPGTGKTSLVKAIAAHTKRHIISVPLSRIRTNQELMDVMFDQVFPHRLPGKGEDGEENAVGSNKHAIKDVVFLLEDVDAASKIVHTRGSTQAKTPSKGDAAKRRGSKVHFEEVEESTLTRQLSTAIQRQATTSLEADEATKQEDANLEESAASKEKEGEKKDVTDSDPTSAAAKSIWDDADKLDLAGLLNILDGVVDAPGRILVMTTNHPEKLDPALLRPGRVNLQIYMGFIACDDAVSMAKHYYPEATAPQLVEVREAFERKHRACVNGLKMSPAEFEQLCAESTETSDLVAAIDKYLPKR